MTTNFLDTTRLNCFVVISVIAMNQAHSSTDEVIIIKPSIKA